MAASSSNVKSVTKKGETTHQERRFPLLVFEKATFHRHVDSI
jgi:hypothetical protein